MNNRILYYAINGTGLGHLMRLTSIAFSCRSNDSSLHQLIVTNSQHVEILKKLSFPYITLPAIEGEVNDALNQQVTTIPRLMMIKILYHIISEYQPKTIVFDTHFPSKLIEKLSQEKKYNLALVLRLCKPDYMLEIFNADFFKKFHSIIFPHFQHEIANYLPKEIAKKISKMENAFFTGSITRLEEMYENKTRHPAPPEDFILITCGAGGYQDTASQFINLAVKAASIIKSKYVRMKVIVVTGPYYKGEDLPKNCEYYHWIENLPLWISRAKLVIAHAGYNTVNEIIESNVRAVLIPLFRKNDDQQQRAEQISSQIKHIKCCYLSTTPIEIAKLIEKLLNSQILDTTHINGALSAAKIILATTLKNKRLASESLKYPFSNNVFSFNKRNLINILTEQNSENITHIVLPFDEVDEEVINHAAKSGIALDVFLGNGAIQDIIERSRQIMKKLTDYNFDLKNCSLIYFDEREGGLLQKIAEFLQQFNFNKLVALVKKEEISSPKIFNIYECCRNLKVPFIIDITTSI